MYPSWTLSTILIRIVEKKRDSPSCFLFICGSKTCSAIWRTYRQVGNPVHGYCNQAQPRNEFLWCQKWFESTLCLTLVACFPGSTLLPSLSHFHKIYHSETKWMLGPACDTDSWRFLVFIFDIRCVLLFERPEPRKPAFTWFFFGGGRLANTHSWRSTSMTGIRTKHWDEKTKHVDTVLMAASQGYSVDGALASDFPVSLKNDAYTVPT